MKILIVNKFLYPNGGSETYIFEIGKQLQKMGHEVQYFGMDHEGRVVGNHAESYTSNMDFHTGKLGKLLYPFKIIYSREARKKIRVVLDDFKPDVVHLNNINFQITPSILYEIRNYEKKNRNKTKIVATAHDYQWVCPNHMMYIPQQNQICERCINGSYINCTKHNCIHNSKIKSLLGSMESYFYHGRKTYDLIDRIICPSEFLKNQLEKDKVLVNKLVTMHNFVTVDREDQIWRDTEWHQKGNYVLYFGRYAKEKGILTLLSVCEQLPTIPFVFAGSGPLEKMVDQCKNVKNVGFQKGDSLRELIAKARFTVYPSEWYENCPFSVMESQMYGTPVVGANIGGIPELIENHKTGELFDAGNVEQIKKIIIELWNDEEKQERYTKSCETIIFDTTETYCEKLLDIYRE